MTARTAGPLLIAAGGIMLVSSSVVYLFVLPRPIDPALQRLWSGLSSILAGLTLGLMGKTIFSGQNHKRGHVLFMRLAAAFNVLLGLAILLGA